MIKAIVIDDEKNARSALKKLISTYGNAVSVSGEASSVSEGVELIKNVNPDLVFLDVEMPGGNGFTLFDKIRPVNFEVIFTTAYDKYALRAIKYSALDYLLKPVGINDLQSAIDRILQVKKLGLNQNRFETLMGNINSPSHQLNKIAIPTLDSYVMIKIADIVYCEANSNYCCIYLFNKEKILVSKTLKWIEDLLPETTFFRIHKSILINLNHVNKYLKAEEKVVMDNGVLLDVADRQRKTFVERLTAR
jgi:two-component system LytT family response regulator